MNRIVAYYGDDFTGSTDVMEALASHGVNTVLFTRLPTAAEFAPFMDYQAFGLAGTSRSQSPEWMDENLPAKFEWLKSLGARLCHYKVCSTFDSSPAIGNIGRAAEIGSAIFAQRAVLLVVGTPQLQRYTFGGNLFAGYQGEIYRIDRHPVMSRHPVTPMDEPDLRLHLAKQTSMPTVLANMSWPENGLRLFDVYDAATQLAAGHQMLDLPALASPFVIGASGVEYALVQALAERREISGTASFAPVAKVEKTIVVSGSVSPTTERQIWGALANGFQSVPVPAVSLAVEDSQVVDDTVRLALQVLANGQSPIVHTALGPATDDGERLNSIRDGRRNIGNSLGLVLRRVMETTGLRRVILAGGDTSSHALGQLDIHALTTRMPLPATPGSPLCVAHSNLPQLNGVELAMKGGQLAGDTYFVQLRDGLS